jgi:hypothetical protein
MPYGTDQKYYRTPQCSQRTNDLLLAPEMTETIYNSFSIDIEQVGFELTCGAVSMRARFAREIKLLLIYEMHFQTADCLDKRARACRAGRLSELLGSQASS